MIDITKCEKVNVTDSCALWNILSSKILFAVLEDQNFIFSCTPFVVYECLYRNRTNSNPGDVVLKQLAKEKIDKKDIDVHPLTIDDLQDSEILRFRNKLGRGELSSIAFAKKTGLCFLTDDQGARKIGEVILGKKSIQTTPLLLGWLLYNGYLTDSDLEPIIIEHKSNGRPLEPYFRQIHIENWRLRALHK